MTSRRTPGVAHGGGEHPRDLGGVVWSLSGRGGDDRDHRVHVSDCAADDCRIMLATRVARLEERLTALSQEIADVGDFLR